MYIKEISKRRFRGEIQHHAKKLFLMGVLILIRFILSFAVFAPNLIDYLEITFTTPYFKLTLD